MDIWTIYDHPSDYPDVYVARRWHLDKTTDQVMVHPDLSVLRKHFHQLGLFRLARNSQDDEKIVECWI